MRQNTEVVAGFQSRSCCIKLQREPKKCLQCSAAMKGVQTLRAALCLLLLSVSRCCSFGFRSCSLNYLQTHLMWCSNQKIVNLTSVMSKMPENITTINLSKNDISHIPAGSFNRVTTLTHLDLSQNKLVSLKGGEFSGLTSLKFLNLTGNNISHFHPQALEGLSGLRSLFLLRNNLQGDFSLDFTFLLAIEKVDLSLNKISYFTSGMSSGSSSLIHLDLFANKLRRLNVSRFSSLMYVRLSNNTELELQNDTFVNNPRLQTLLVQGVKAEMLMKLPSERKKNLTNVSFSLLAKTSPWSVCEVMREMERLMGVEIDLEGSKFPKGVHNLLDCNTPRFVSVKNADFGDISNITLGHGRTEILYLINCGIRRTSKSTFKDYHKLRTLQMSQNKLELNKETFQGLPHVTFLSLDKNKIHFVDPSWFVPLTKLTRLSLSKNQITELAPKAFSSLTRLEQLYLQFNLLKYITGKPFGNLRRLWKLNLSLNIIDFIEEGTFQDLTGLKYLDLSGNRIKRLTPLILEGLHNLQKLVLYNNRLHFQSYERPFVNLVSLEYLQMEYQGPGGQGLGTIGINFFEGQKHLISLTFGESIHLNIHPDAFTPLDKLRYLYISGVSLKDTNLTSILRPLKQLLKLTLHRADLDRLPPTLLPPNNSLEILKVHSNHIQTVDKEMLEALQQLKFLDFRDNPLFCTCQNAWFQTWAINNKQTQVAYLYNLQCDNDQKPQFLWQFDNRACSYDWLSLTLFITCSLLDALLVCVCLTWHLYGPTLRYLQLLIRAKLGGHKGHREKFQYDAFVSYSSRDEEWVMEELVPRLERPAAGAEPQIRLCLHHRDFRPGAAVLENIESAIHSSRHTICVVTRPYVQSEWCSVEFQLASLRLLCDGSDVLLLIFLEEIPEHCLSASTRLRKIVRKKTYLLWPEHPQDRKAFWIRLRNALTDNENGEIKANEGIAQLHG